MKNFKRLFILVFVAIFTIVLIGCNKKPSADETKLNEMADRVYLGQTDEINNDLKLPKYAFGDKEFAITWESSDTSVIEVKEYETEDKELYYHGSVSMANEVKNVILTATIKYKDLSTTRKFEITVLADEYVGYENIAAVKAKEDKTKDVSKVKFSGTVSFTTNSGFGVSDGSASIYCYQSGHGRTVGEKVEVRGVWTYYKNMVQIASGCVVKSLGMDSTFSIANLAETKTITEIAALEAKTVDPENCTRIFKTTFVAKANASGDYNKYKLVDPTDSSKFVDVSKYNDADTITYVGELVEAGKFYEGIVIIYCSRSAGNGGLWDVLLVPSTVKEVEVKLSDSQIVSGILSDLNAAFNGKKVKENLELPTTHTSGATISWVSNNESVISSTGVYTAPSANTEVKLTATVKLNNETQTVEVTVVAAGEVKTVASLVTNPQVGVAYKLGIDQKELGQILFANGAMSGYYGATITEHTDAIDVYLEAVEGGYYVYTMVSGAKKYIAAEVNVTPDKTHINFKYLDSTNVAWVYNAEYNTITCTVSEKEVFIGTKGSYNTIGGYELSTIANGYPVHFYEEVEDKAYTSAPEVGTAYKLGIDQQTLEQMLYFTGTMSGYYGATVETYAEGIDVFFEVNGEGYNLYFMLEGAKKYITAVVSEKDGKTYKNFTIADAADNVWKFNSEYSTVVTTVNGLELFMGTRGSYNTVSVYETKEIADDYPVHFYTKDVNGGTVNPEPDPKPEPDPEPSVDEYVKEIEVGKAYKFFINQEGLGKVLYFTGAMDGYYGATTEVFAEGVDVFFEVNGNGYSLYFMLDGAKKYITAVVSGTHKNFTIADKASTVWTFDTTNYTLTCDLEGTTCYMGTYGTYKTFSVSSIDKLATSYPSRFVLAEGGSVTPDPKPEPDPTPEVIDATVTEILAAAKDLADGSVLEAKYTAKGTVTEVTDAYSEQLKNITFKLTDGTSTILCYRVKGDEAANVKVGDTITLTGEIKNYGGTIEFVNATIIAREAGSVTPDPEPSNADAEIVFDVKEKMTEYSVDKQVWKNGEFVVTNNKHESTQDVKDYVNPARFYANTNLVFEFDKEFKTIVLYTKERCYTGDEEIAGATLTVVDGVMTLVLDTPATSFTIEKLVSQIRVVKAQLFVGEASVEPEPTPDPEPTPEVIDATVTQILAAAKDLADGSVLEAKYTAKGKVTEVTDAYSDQFKNVSFQLSDGTNTILCYRVKGDEAANVKVGDTITLTGEIKNYGGTIEFVNATIIAREAGTENPEPTPDVTPSAASINLTDKNNRTEFSAEKQVWVENGITVTNNKNNSKTDVADYAQARFYVGSEVIIEYTSEITKIVIDTADGKCYKADNIIEGATLTVESGVMTLVLTTPAKSFKIAEIVTQIRAEKIDVYTENGGTVTPTPDPKPEPEPDPEPSTDPFAKEIEVGKAYKFFINQEGLGKVLYFKGTMNGYYGASTEAFAEGVDVFFEVNGSGYSLYFMLDGAKKYITAVVSGTHKNFTIADKASTVWTFDATNYTLTCDLEGTTCYMGTYGTYNTFSVSSIDKLATSYPARFVLAEGGEVTPEPDPEPTPDPEPSTDPFVKEIVVGNAYKFFINQEGLGKVLYFKGVMSGYYGASTENREEGVDVFFEVNGDGYSLYFMLDGAKKYINAVQSGTYTNFKIEDKASTVWTFDTNNYTLTCTLNNNTYYMGTYGTYNTFSVSAISFINTSFPARFELVEVVEQPEEPELPEEPEIEIPESGINWPIEDVIPGFVVEYITKDSTIAEVLKMAEKLEDGENLDYAYRVTGIIKEITGAYNSSYKNVSFILTDGTEGVECFRVSGDEAANVKVGDTITLIGLMKNYKGTLEFVNGIITERIPAAPAPGTGDEPVLAGTADLGAIVTPNAFGDSSYTKTYTSPNGWVSKNSAIQTGGTKDMNPTFMVIGSDDTCKAVCLNGKTTATGSLTSPELEGGISILKFKWAKMFTDTAIKFTVTITDLSTNAQYTKVIEWAGGKNENQKVANEVEFKLDTPINGKFIIKFENNCPSAQASNKDRASIFDIEWYK